MKMIAIGLLAASTSIMAPAQTANTPPVATASIPQADLSAYAALPNGPGSGPFPAVMEVDSTLPEHVIYRPANLALATKGRKLGVLIWGNGGCRDDGASARQHLIEIASHGYLVIAPGRILSGPTAPPQSTNLRRSMTDGRLPPVATTAADVRNGLDWALAQNRSKGSRWFAKIDPGATAAAGHSCGGLQALQLAGDPRIKAVLIHNSGVFADGTNPIQGISVDKSLLKTIHTPIVYFLGGPTDVAFPNGSDDYAKISHVPATLVSMPVGHGGTFFRANGGAVASASVDWLQWQLRGDMSAARTFVGTNCRLCTVPGWTIERKGWPN